MKQPLRRTLYRIGLALLVVLGSALVTARLAGFGCIPRSHPPQTAAPQSEIDLLEGNWLGTWTSTQRDMGGTLRCRIEMQDAGAYRAQFDAVFAKYLTNQSTVTLRVQRKGTTWHFTGQEDLGLLKGGVYTYEGHSDGGEFLCRYDSKYDKGTFRLKRLPTTTAPVNGVIMPVGETDKKE